MKILKRSKTNNIGKHKPINFKISKKIGITTLIITAVIACLILGFHHNPFADPTEELIKKVIACGIITIGVSSIVWKYDNIVILPLELYQNRKLIWKLSKNDFKTRYAGSYLGIVWAFVQPVVTILVYWFVFGTGISPTGELFKTEEMPYVLYLTAGIIPWFFFSEAITNGTTALLEYKYLVKQVVFKISILPIIKITAASFIHIFFVSFMLLLNIMLGNTPDIHWLQLIYFSGCMYIFVLALSYATCAMVLFFRDLSQIISIILQVGMWATPIMWPISKIPEQFQIIFKLNPIYYIVNGYRSALFEKVWFWEDFYSTMFFWIITVILFGIGAVIFKRLKPHFADVL